MWNIISFEGVVSPSEERVQVALEELQDLKGVWIELSKIWEQIDELKEKTWLSVAPRKVCVNFRFSFSRLHLGILLVTSTLRKAHTYKN